MELITLLTTGLTTVTAVYIRLFTHPAWLKSDVRSAIENFTLVFKGFFRY